MEKLSDEAAIAEAAVVRQPSYIPIGGRRRVENPEKLDLEIIKVHPRANLPLVFLAHQRTRGNLEKFDLDLGPGVILNTPLPYTDFLNLWKNASLTLTDSDGLWEEIAALGISSLTLR